MAAGLASVRVVAAPGRWYTRPMDDYTEPTAHADGNAVVLRLDPMDAIFITNALRSHMVQHDDDIVRDGCVDFIDLINQAVFVIDSR